jgi:hypothetical protein
MLQMPLISIGLVLCLIAWFLSPDRLDRMFARGAAWYLRIFAPLVFLALFQLYVTRLFPYLPSEFGGPAMQAVRLDLKKSELSPETSRLLATAPDGQGDTVRTGVVRIVMAPGDFYLVLLAGDAKSKHVKIRADAVRAIIPAP